MERLESRGSKRPQALKAYALKRFGADHPDEYFFFYFRAHVKPFISPLLIIGSKYDEFKGFESYYFLDTGNNEKYTVKRFVLLPIQTELL
jgi:hypothetical protein